MLTAQGRETIFEWLVRAMVLFLCLPVHEFAHAWMARKLGDDTAERQGRLTLNPIRHLDPWGGLLLIFVGFGWAKPVPVNPNRFKHPKAGMALTSAAGPLSNLVMGTLLLALLKVLYYTVFTGSYMSELFYSILSIMIFINIGLAVFNLLPIPPLDGSKLFGAILPDRVYYNMMRYERYIMIALIILLWTGVLDVPLGYLRGLLLTALDFVTRPIDLFFLR